MANANANANAKATRNSLAAVYRVVGALSDMRRDGSIIALTDRQLAQSIVLRSIR